MRYDHARKAGNRADVWKHFILLELIATAVRDGGFIHYVETHAGGRVHALGEAGEWREGIGRLGSVPEGLRSAAYFEMIRLPMDAGSSYPSSWWQVAEALRRRRVTSAITLFDTDSSVAASMQDDKVLLDSRGIRFIHSDGYGNAARLAPGFVFIDPPYKPSFEADVRRSAGLVAALLEAQIPGAVWYPILDGNGGSVPFPGRRYEIAWPPAAGMPGCGMHCFGRLPIDETVLEEHLNLLAEKLGGRFRPVLQIP